LKQNLIKLSIITLLIILLCSGASFAQSFDCKKAVSKTEKRVCASSKLKKLDIELDRLYKELLKDPKKNKERIVGWQREWIKFRERDIEDNLTKIYQDRIIEFSVWIKETSSEAAPVNPNPSPKWKDSEKKIIAEMYEIYKRDGFDHFYIYAAEKRSCTDKLMNFFKLNFEPIDPVAASKDPYDPVLQEAMGECGELNLVVACLGGSWRGFIGGYEIYNANFDDKEGDEILLIGKKSRLVYGYDYNEGRLIYKNIWSDSGEEANFFLFDPSNNCTTGVNSLGKWYFFKRTHYDDDYDIKDSERRYAMWASFFNPRGQDFYYGVALYGGRAYVYNLEARDNSSYSLHIDNCVGDINIFSIPQK
jgi:uncharacterized protein YecT (DUF1311 family)